MALKTKSSVSKKHGAIESEISDLKGELAREWRRFMALSDEEKERESDAAAKRPRSKDKPISRAEHALMARSGRGARLGVGRPRTGNGAKVVSISVERGLLAQADAHAKSLGITRAQLVATGLRLAMDGR